MNMTVTFSTQCDLLAAQAGASQLVFVVKGLIMARDAGGTNKGAARALWATVSDDTTNALSVLKRINGGLNAPKPDDSQKELRSLWIAADDADDFLAGLTGKGIKTAKQLQLLCCPAKEQKTPTVKSAVEIFLNAASEEGFSDDLTPLLVWLAEGTSLPAMLDFATRATAEKEGKAADAAKKQAERQAEIDAKKSKAEKAKASKAARDAERSRLHAEKVAAIDKATQDEKSAQAKKAHEAKVARERATHPKVRAVIEA